MAIRITGALSDRVIDVVEKFNRKVRRLAKEGNFNLPSQVNWRDVLYSATNRKDLERELDLLSTFNKRGAEKSIVLESGVRTTKYEYEVAKKRQALAKRRIKRLIKQYQEREATEYGEKQGLYYYRMGDNTYENYLSRLEKLSRSLETMSNFKSYSEYLENVARINYTVRDKVYMSNFLNEMIFNIGYVAGYDKNKIREMKDKIYNNLTDGQITNMLNSEAAFTSLREWYNNIHRREGLNKTNLELINAEFNELYANLDKIIETYAQ